LQEAEDANNENLRISKKLSIIENNDDILNADDERKSSIIRIPKITEDYLDSELLRLSNKSFIQSKIDGLTKNDDLIAQ
jgi:hypothetical protein